MPGRGDGVPDFPPSVSFGRLDHFVPGETLGLLVGVRQHLRWRVPVDQCAAVLGRNRDAATAVYALEGDIATNVVAVNMGVDDAVERGAAQPPRVR